MLDKLNHDDKSRKKKYNKQKVYSYQTSDKKSKEDPTVNSNANTVPLL
jgi:hypothetical protein